MRGHLNRRLKGKRINEITLFREINSILSKRYSSTLIEETHQHKIDFKSKAINAFVSREISDLLIIVFSRKRKIGKMTFLQAKYEKTKVFNGGRFSFKGDFFQYELLSTRPTIKSNSRKFTFPSDILSSSNFDSVGSFGVFYKDSKGSLDMAYAAANELSAIAPVTTIKQKSRMLYFPNLNANNFIIKIQGTDVIELRATQSINCFTVGLLSLLIGGEFINQKSVVSFLKGYFMGRPQSETTSQQFLNFLNDNSDIEQIDRGEITGLGNVLLINLDETVG